MNIKNIALSAIAICGLAISSQAQRGLDLRAGSRSQQCYEQAGHQQGRHSKGLSRRNDSRRGPRGDRSNRRYEQRRGDRYGHRRVHVHVSSKPRYRTTRVWVPGCSERVFEPARYELRWDSCGRRKVRVCVQPAGYRIVHKPGYWEYRRVRTHRHVERRFHFH